MLGKLAKTLSVVSGPKMLSTRNLRSGAVGKGFLSSARTTVVEKVTYGSCTIIGYLVKIYPKEMKKILLEKKRINLQRFLGVYLYCVSGRYYIKIKRSQVNQMKS